ncbi:low molecular weight phosphotyrosine protein phosphatase-like [Chironomus tepperi]|uniref:low molecular weight phosphotyrosine protein phosphatase-like n=1 Tax=Chironomus tepperi TaxID=113505 RepID=UPI00391F660E
METSNQKINVLFVCFGNTCRSPMAEAILKDFAEKRNVGEKFHIDSAAISNWQVGCDINQYVDEILNQIGIKNFTHKARQISYKDFTKFDYIFGMDYFHIGELSEAAETLKSSSKVVLLGNYNPNQNEKVIHDPICGDKEVFEKCYEQISASCEVFLNELLNSQSQ